MQELEDALRAYFGKTVVAVKLISGELLIGFASNYSEVSFDLNFPFQVDGRTIKPYCDIVREKSFKFALDHCIFSKKPTPEFIEVYLGEVVSSYPVELNGWLLKLTKDLIASSMEADRVVH